jgi:hypothetical protein
VIEYNEIELNLPKPPSLNQFYAGKHWTVRSKQKETYWKAIEKELDSIDRFHMERFSIYVRYNCRFDVDNAIVCSKFLADYLRNNGYVEDDTPSYFFAQKTEYAPELEKNTFIAKLKCYGYKKI